MSKSKQLPLFKIAFLGLVFFLFTIFLIFTLASVFNPANYPASIKKLDNDVIAEEIIDT